MSSVRPIAGTGAGGGGGGGDPSPRRYFCHQCDRTVTLTPSLAASDLACPICHGGFLEEFNVPDPNPSPYDDPFSFFLSDFFPDGQGDSMAASAHSPVGLLSLLNLDGVGPRRSRRAAAAASSDAFNPSSFLHSLLQNLAARGGDIELIVGEAQGGLLGGRGASTFGDYLVGPGLEQLIEQLMDNDPNRYGTPPASKSAVETLPDLKISEDMLASDEAQCAVCKDIFEVGNEAKQMPCKHVYHKDCILPWLELHNSCPVCRYELPTDDPDYEQQKGVAPPPSQGTDHANANSGYSSTDASGSGGETGEVDSPRSGAVERRFRIRLPWPFSGIDSFLADESSRNEVDSSDEAGNGPDDTDRRGYGDPGSDTSQEDQ